MALLAGLSSNQTCFVNRGSCDDIYSKLKLSASGPATQSGRVSCKSSASVGFFRARKLHISLKTGLCRNEKVQSYGRRASFCTASALDPTTGNEKVELIYDPKSKLDELTSQISSSASATKLTLFSPCKINVFLRITGKRPDGYHELASLFHVISLGDIIKFSISPSSTKDSLTTNVGGIPLDDRNLILKALNLYRQKTGSNVFFWIHLDKRIPTGAGLGGGSGNAATALWAANQLSGFHVSEKVLQEWSGEIGSDVPFFFSNGAAYCTGRGEVVQDVYPMPLDLPLVLMKPKEECSTAEVYKCFRLGQASSVDPLKLLEEITSSGISQRVCINDLEPPAFQVLPSLKILKERVLAAGIRQYQAVFMSGSGSTIVGVGDHEPPQFLYEEEHFQDVFISEANFLTRKEGEWYQAPISECLIGFGDKSSITDACRS